MPTQLPRGARAIAKAGIAFCRVLDRHPLVEASDPSALRQAAYAAVKTACAALQELVPDRFVDPGQDPALTALDFTDGVVVPTQYRHNGGRLIIRIERAGLVTFSSVGLSPFNPATGAFTDTSGTYGNITDVYNALLGAMAGIYKSDTVMSLHSVEATVGGNLTVVSPSGVYAAVPGGSSASENPLWIISTFSLRTGVAKQLLRMKLPGTTLALGKADIVANSSGTPQQVIAQILIQAGGGVQAYNGQKPRGNVLSSTADNKREYARLTK